MADRRLERFVLEARISRNTLVRMGITWDGNPPFPERVMEILEREGMNPALDIEVRDDFERNVFVFRQEFLASKPRTYTVAPIEQLRDSRGRFVPAINPATVARFEDGKWVADFPNAVTIQASFPYASTAVTVPTPFAPPQSNQVVSRPPESTELTTRQLLERSRGPRRVITRKPRPKEPLP